MRKGLIWIILGILLSFVGIFGLVKLAIKSMPIDFTISHLVMLGIGIFLLIRGFKGYRSPKTNDDHSKELTE